MTYDRKKTADLLGIAVSTLRRWEHLGWVPKPRKLPRTGRTYYTKEDVDLLLKFRDGVIEPFNAAA